MQDYRVGSENKYLSWGYISKLYSQHRKATINTMYSIWVLLTFATVINFAQSLIIEYEGTHNIFNAKFVNVDLELLNNTDANYTYDGYKVYYTNEMFLLVGLDDSIMPSNDKREITKETREEWTNVIPLGSNFVKSSSNTSLSDLLSQVSKRDDEVVVSGLHITERYLNIGSTYNNIVIGSVTAAGAAALAILKFQQKGYKHCETYTTQHGATWYKIHTCTTGHNCDTTASGKIVKEADEHALTDAYRHKSFRGSYSMNHGGTWHSCVEYYQKDHHDKSFPGCPAKWCG